MNTTRATDEREENESTTDREIVEEVTASVTWRTVVEDASDDDRTAPPALDEATRREVNVLIARVEAVNWSDVPGVSSATARAFTTALEHALEVSR